MSFLSFLDHRVADAIMGVEWTIPIEVFCYATLPAIAALGGRSLKVLWLIFLAAIAVSVLSQQGFRTLLPPDAGWLQAK